MCFFQVLMAVNGIMSHLECLLYVDESFLDVQFLTVY